MTTENSTTLKKTEASQGEHPVKEKAEEKVDIRKDLTEDEAKKLIAKENGEEPETKEDKKTEEEPKTELPERYKGKTPEELVKILDEKEKFIQSQSNEVGDWKKKVKEAEILREKVAKIEEDVSKESQRPSRLPQRPQAPTISDDEYYDNPTKSLNKLVAYNQKLADYVDQLTSAKTAPFYQGDMERKREKLYKGLEEKYKDYPVPFDRSKIQEFLNKNPEYFRQYKTKAYEQAYHDLSAEDFSKNRKKEEQKIREEIEKRVREEIRTGKQAANVGLSDLETPQAGSPEYDKNRMEEDSAYRDQVIADMEKRNK